MGPVARLLPDGQRLHLQHGPIDLVIGADGERALAFDAARARFETVLEELVAELDLLRAPMVACSPPPDGAIARRMHAAAQPFCHDVYLTRMAAVAGAVADEVLAAMTFVASLSRAYVNNGGDIALFLSEDASFTTAMQDHRGRDLGRISICADDAVRGIATSGRHGRSLSRGIADSVTVLGANAASADVAATLIGNAVDLPGHMAVARRAADAVIEDSDLGSTPVVVGCGALSARDCTTALDAGHTCALDYQTRGLIHGAALSLYGHAKTSTPDLLQPSKPEPLYA